jgi:hypothetical protein
VLIPTIVLYVLSLLYASSVWRRLPGLGARCGALLAVAVAGALMWASLSHYVNVSLPALYGDTSRALWQNTADALRLVDGSSDAATVYDTSVRGLHEIDPLPTVEGTVDVYAFNQVVLEGHDAAYRPRPVMQSYAAYTPALAEMNAKHLREPGAADSILFDIATIDERYPSLDDGPSWPELLTRYDVRDCSGNFIELRRASAPRAYRFDPIGEARGSLGAPIAVPSAADGPIWAQVDVRPTLFGRLTAQLFRSPYVFITVELADGSERRYRLIPSMARGGFLLSPLVDGKDAFLWLALDGWQDRLDASAVTSLSVTVASQRAWYYEDEVSVVFSRLSFPKQAVTSENVREFMQMSDLARNRVSPIVQPGVIEGPSGLAVSAHPPDAMTLPLDAAPARVSFEFGIRDEAWQGANQTDGVEFRVSAVVAGRRIPIWTRYLDPLHNPADRGVQRASVAEPHPNATALVFETLPGPTIAWDWAYLANVRLE